ncbi:MAG: hypothetical protein Q9212_006146 [Teloschistes hypoglaucus]
MSDINQSCKTKGYVPKIPRVGFIVEYVVGFLARLGETFVSVIHNEYRVLHVTDSLSSHAPSSAA